MRTRSIRRRCLIVVGAFGHVSGCSLTIERSSRSVRFGSRSSGRFAHVTELSLQTVDRFTENLPGWPTIAQILQNILAFCKILVLCIEQIRQFGPLLFLVFLYDHKSCFRLFLDLFTGIRLIDATCGSLTIAPLLSPHQPRQISTLSWNFGLLLQPNQEQV